MRRLLSPEFLGLYKHLPPKFGYNGLGEIVYRKSYSRMLPDGNHEVWADTVARVVEGTFRLARSYRDLEWQPQAQAMYDLMFNFKFLPPGRGLWAMGSPITDEKHLYAALNNCAFVSTQDLGVTDPTRPFAFLMDASMLGVGVGFDTKGAGKLFINEPIKSAKVFKVPDTREGWVESLQELLSSYFKPSQLTVEFDYSLVRPAGVPLKVFGGISSGPDPLKSLHTDIRQVLGAKVGETLGMRGIVDIMNLIGRTVVAGNIRRSAEIAFGAAGDEEFLHLKDYNRNPERAAYGWTSNNTVLAEQGMDYRFIADCILKNGEPGLAWLENMQAYSRMGEAPDYKDYRALGGNPCLEQTLESYELCCLVEVFPASHDSLEEFLHTLKYAYMYAKIVSLGPTHWPESNEVMSRNRRIGCSLTGIAQFVGDRGLKELKLWCETGYSAIARYDAELSKLFGVPESIKRTSVKPSGTVSLLAGATPGIHFPLARNYIRRVRVAESDTELLEKLRKEGYEIEDEVQSRSNAKVVSVPIKLSANVKTLNEASMYEQLSLAAFMQKYWADNQVSCTVSFNPETEGPHIASALEYFQFQLKGVSFLPKVPSIPYPQMPYEEITDAEYERLSAKIVRIDGQTPRADRPQISEPENFCDSCL
jgi:adenosylcobalamin-dependent ribonucleoside-triphosphate reductase